MGRPNLDQAALGLDAIETKMPITVASMRKDRLNYKVFIVHESVLL